MLAVVMLLKQQELLQLPAQNHLCSLSCHLSSSPTGFLGEETRAGIFVTRDKGDFLPAAQGKMFCLEEQEDPGAEQRQIWSDHPWDVQDAQFGFLKELKPWAEGVFPAGAQSRTLGTA